MTIKNNIRAKHLQQRTQLPKQQSKHLSEQICDKILSSDVFQQSETVACYMPVNNEVDLTTLFTQEKIIALPVIQAHHGMSFNQFESMDQLVKNKYGILEPSNSLFIAPKNVDLCLLPLVGFNRKGARLGMGGGYYDRYFELNKFQKKPTILAGVAYDFQEDDTIQTQAWDIPLDLIFTNQEVIEI